MKLLTSNAKLDKANKKYLNLGLSFAEGNKSGREVCTWRGDCFKSCVNESGMNKFPAAQNAKIERTKLFFEDRKAFDLLLRAELTLANIKAKKKNQTLAVRLNLGSDIMWEREAPWIFTEFKDIVFYDYTKAPWRVRPYSATFPQNYHLTYSVSERSHIGEIAYNLEQNRNVAAVFPTKDLPKKFLGYRVIDGDKHDLRFLDPIGVVVGLRAKNGAVKKSPRFVQL
jgi:hypothetical protein